MRFVQYLAAHIELLQENKSSGTLHDAVYKKPSPLLTIKATIDGSMFETLIDPGSQINIISAIRAKELDLHTDPLTPIQAHSMDGTDIKIYGTTIATVEVTDSRGRREMHGIPFVVMERPVFHMVLGLPWIDEVNPKLSYASRRMLFRGRKAKDERPHQPIALEDADEFDRTMRSAHSEVYACLVGSVGRTTPTSAKEGQMPIRYADFRDVGLPGDDDVLAGHGPQDLAIEMAEGAEPPHRPLYNLSVTELSVLRKYISDALEKGWIRHSKSPAGAPILFAKKKDGTLRLCVDYRGLNKVTVKNRHPLPLITESLERLAEATIFTKLDIRDAYHRIRIKEGDEWKTAFRTRYGHFEYLVMPFGLTNAPAQFQAYMNQALAGLVDVTCVIYLDDILIFSKTETEHEAHVKEVLQRLREFKLYVKLSKCEWHTRQTEFLGYIVSPEGVSVDPGRVKTVQDWPIPRTVRDVRVFIGFMNYYRRFIHQFSKFALPLTELTQKGPNSAKGGRAQKREESQQILMGKPALDAFQKLKDSFLEVPVLAHFESSKMFQTRVEVDASGGAIAGILSQKGPRGAEKPTWRPVDFFSRKMIQAEYNYDTHDKELLAIVKSLEHYRHYLQGIRFEVHTDHHNLKWFMDTKVLNHRQVRSYILLSKFDFTIVHKPGITNPADAPSRRPDYMAEAQRPEQKHNYAFVKPMRDLLAGNDAKDPFLVLATIERVLRPKGNLTSANEARTQGGGQPQSAPSDSEESLLSDEEPTSGEEDNNDLAHIGQENLDSAQGGQIELTTAEGKAIALRECHNDPLAGHFGARKTIEKLKRRYAWKGMYKDVQEYCSDCLWCRRSAAAKHKPYGLLQPLQPPEKAWEDTTMDFITELPPSRSGGQVYDSILVVVDRLTKMSHYIPARADWDGSDLAQCWVKEIIRLHGVPKRIISDRGPLMNARHWKTFNYYLNSKRVLSSAFHPQTDGQTERQNQTLEQYLRCYCTLEQDDWAQWLPIAEFAYNDSVNATTGITPFASNYGLNPRSADWPELAQTDGASASALEMAEKVLSIQKTCRERIAKSQDYQQLHANKRRLPSPFKVGDEVLVSNRNIRSSRPKKKLDWKYLGPGKIVAQYGPTTFKVDLPGLKSIHPVFHASLLEPYKQKGTIPQPKATLPETLRMDSDDVYEVNKILDKRLREDGTWEYLISWRGYAQSEDSWEPGANISGDLLKKYWKDTNMTTKRHKADDTGVVKKRGRGRPRIKRRA